MTTPPGPARPLLVCVGDLMVDVAVAAPALRRGGDVPGSVRLGPGGSAANVAVWAGVAGADALVVARRGDDLAGRLLAAALADRGVGLHPPAPARAATGAMLVVTESGERTFVADPGANLHLAVGDVAAALAGAAAVFVSGYPLLRPETRAAALAAAGAGPAGIPAAVDAASWPLVAGAAGEPVLAAAALAGTLLANLDEAAALTGRRDPAVAAVQLAARVGTAVVKCGADGVVVCAATTGRPLTVTAGVAEVADVTGAGDAFAAGYLVALAAGAEPAEAAGAGNLLAARAVAAVGAWPAAPT
ncbi:MAG TPA: carbohydrate kinase family protein [Actinomycetota bacterium]|nr:carbohydrate kinase family protein [Actinomycetota bacterium]